MPASICSTPSPKPHQLSPPTVQYMQDMRYDTDIHIYTHILVYIYTYGGFSFVMGPKR